ncbi:MAG: hypothetical protein ACE15E_01505 [Acidobacteriota bacterium]
MTKRSIYLPLAVCAFLMAAAAVPVEEKETLRRQFSPAAPGAPMSLLIDNIWGGITVVTHSRPDIQVVVTKRLTAPSEAVAREFAEKVKLDVSQAENHVRLYVDGPFRRCHGRRQDHDWDRLKDARLACDYQVTVPVRARLELKTVLDGDINVTGSAGEFDISVVTGTATLSGISGFGRVSTITGALTADFARNPDDSCYFRTISGKVRVSFPRDLSADLYFKTLQGDVFTDFSVTPLPGLPVRRESRNGKSIYKVDEFYRVRVGKGGPELKFDTPNGDVEIHDRAL